MPHGDRIASHPLPSLFPLVARLTPETMKYELHILLQKPSTAV
jgi:hypothetical protein